MMLQLSTSYHALRAQGLGAKTCQLFRRVLLPKGLASTAANYAMSDSKGITIAWLRIGDLRVTDHEPLHRAVLAGDDVIPFFCLDDEILNKAPQPEALGLPVTGPHRLTALFYILLDLRKSLRAIGSDLISASGSTADVLRQLVTALLTDYGTRSGPSYLCLRYYTAVGDPMNTRIEQRAEAAFSAAAAHYDVPASIDRCWGHTAHHPSDIPAASCEDVDAGDLSRVEAADLKRIVELLSIDTSMTAFLETLKKCSRVRKPLPRMNSMSQIPVYVLKAAKDDQKLLGLDSLELLFNEDDGVTTIRAALQDVYAAAGALDAYQTFEKLLLANENNIKSFGEGLSLSGGGCGAGQRAIEQHRGFPLTEFEAQAHLDRILNNGMMRDYARTRMMACSIDSSAGLSAALSFGTLSPRTVYWATMAAYVESYEGGASISGCAWHAPTSTSPGLCWLLMHVIGIRDYFLYSSITDGNALYDHASGPAGKSNLVWDRNLDLITAWARGRTGFPFVDASMRQLMTTGFTSNRCRQNAASFLAVSLRQDWRLGAEVFQSLLIDHDAGLNWGNWAYVAGVGRDPRRGRVFRTVTQGELYDPNGAFIMTWVRELHITVDGSDIRCVHRPWESADQQEMYPPPIVDVSSQIGKKK